MQKTGPDSLCSWAAVLYCSLISMLLYGIVGISGIMFVVSMEHFQVDRRSASTPYILCDVIQAMAGLGFGLSSLLLPAIITQHFVKRRAIAISLVYVGSYVGLAFLPNVADLLIYTYGLSGTYLFLSGFLLQCVPLSMLLRNPSAEKAQPNAVVERLKATSINAIDECVMKDSKYSVKEDTFHNDRFLSSHNRNSRKENGTLISDVITQYRQKQQDNQQKRRLGTELLNCEDLHNVVKSNAFTLRYQNVKSESFVHNNTLNYDLKVESDAGTPNYVNGQNEVSKVSKSCLGKVNEGFRCEDLTTAYRNHQCPTAELLKPKTKLKNRNNQAELSSTPKLVNFQRIRSSPDIFHNAISNEFQSEIPCVKNDKNCDKFSNDPKQVLVNLNRSLKTADNELYCKPSNKSTVVLDHSQKCRIPILTKQELKISDCLKLFLEPVFLLVLFGMATYSSSYVAFITVIVDFTIDIGMTEADGNFVIRVFSIASIIGLLSLWLLTGGGYLSLTNLSALMFLSRACTLCVIPFSNGFIMLLCIVSVQGFIEASLANMFPLITAEYYVNEIHDFAISCRLFFCGPMNLVTPPVIGFFRDDLGSYLYLFLLMATQSLICSILYFMALVLARWRCGRDDWILRKTTQII